MKLSQKKKMNPKLRRSLLANTRFELNVIMSFFLQFLSPRFLLQIWLNYSKIAILLGVWAFFTAILIITDEENLPAIPMSVPENRTKGKDYFKPLRK